jgi:hypothetical protein
MHVCLSHHLDSACPGTVGPRRLSSIASLQPCGARRAVWRRLQRGEVQDEFSLFLLLAWLCPALRHVDLPASGTCQHKIAGAMLVSCKP